MTAVYQQSVNIDNSSKNQTLEVRVSLDQFLSEFVIFPYLYFDEFSKLAAIKY